MAHHDLDGVIITTLGAGMNIKLMIVIAIIAIGVGVYGMNHRKIISPSTPKVEVKEKTIAVYVAKKQLQPGDSITSQTVSIENWSETKARSQGITGAISINYSLDPVAKVIIEPGTVISKSSFAIETDVDYIDFIIHEGMTPYPLQVESKSIIGGVIRTNSFVDIMALASGSQNLANDRSIKSYKDVSLSPILTNIKVLKISEEKLSAKGKSADEKSTLILEVTPKQVATLTIAQRIAQLEIHQSVKGATAKDLSANAGDVLESYHAIREFRAGSMTVK